MAKSTKPETKTASAPSKVATGNTTKFSTKPTVPQGKFMFDQMNYIIMFVGLVVLVIGFMTMIGGSPSDPNVFDKAEKYSTRRITIAPMLIILGFFIEVVAIFYRPKTNSETTSNTTI
jgi:hypothetical protein